MRKTLVAAGLAVATGLLWCPDAGAVPADAVAVRDAATAASVIDQAQYSERRTRHGVVKCFRDFVVGPYRCHRYYGPL